MKKEYRPSIIKIIIIMLAAAILFGLSPQSRQALAAEYTKPVSHTTESLGNESVESAQYRDIQIVGQVIALFAGALFLLLALTPIISFRDQDQPGRSDECHFSNECF